MKLGVVDPFPIKRNERIDNGAVPTRHQRFFRTIRLQEHQIGPRRHLNRILHFGEIDSRVIPKTRSPHIYNVVIPAHPSVYRLLANHRNRSQPEEQSSHQKTGNGGDTHAMLIMEIIRSVQLVSAFLTRVEVKCE